MFCQKHSFTSALPVWSSIKLASLSPSFFLPPFHHLPLLSSPQLLKFVNPLSSSPLLVPQISIRFHANVFLFLCRSTTSLELSLCSTICFCICTCNPSLALYQTHLIYLQLLRLSQMPTTVCSFLHLRNCLHIFNLFSTFSRLSSLAALADESCGAEMIHKTIKQYVGGCNAGNYYYAR